MYSHVTHRMIAIVLLGVLAATLLHVQIAAAEARRGLQPDTFRILFPEGSSTPYQDGEHGERNRAAIRHMERVFQQWSDAPGIRFLFVASRSDICNGATRCSAEHLLWQRVNETAVLLRSTMGEGKVRFDRIGQAFQDEFLLPPLLLPVPPRSGSIELRIHVDGNRPEAADRCPWQVLLFDPGVPAVIGESEGKPVIPVRPGSSISIGRRAMIRLARPRGGSANAAAVWENNRGEFCRPSAAIFSEEGESVPPLVGRLHLLAPAPEDKDMPNFLADLTTECRSARLVPSVLQRKVARSGSRDMGDDIQFLPPASLHPSRKWSAEHCDVSFVLDPNP